MTSTTKAVRITREKLYPVAGHNYRRAWKWCYSYELDGVPLGYVDGTTLPDLVRRLKRQHPGATIVKAWENPA